VKIHSFVDDTQLVRHSHVRDIVAAKHDMVSAIAEIVKWSQSHRLKLNAHKSEVIWLGTRQQLAKLSSEDKVINLSDSSLSASTTVRNLGVQFDEQLTFDYQALCCARSCYYHLRRIRQIRCFLDTDALRSLVHAFVTSRLDYCNVLYAGCNVRTHASDCRGSRTVQLD
jgi:hypothetical protein